MSIVHPRFDTRGGAEVVCFNTLEALQPDNDLFLFSFDEPDFDALDEFCGTDARPIPTWYPKRVGLAFDRMISTLGHVAGGHLGNVNIFRTALLNPLVRHRFDRFDMSVCAGGEMALPAPTLQFIHLPIFNGRFDAAYGTNGLASRGHDEFCSQVTGMNRETAARATLLANSNWTADVVESRYGIRPDVLYPAVHVDEFYDIPWMDRENGFTLLGWIAPDKWTLNVIEIIEAVRECGHDVHLHLVGPTKPHSRYGRQVKRWPPSETGPFSKPRYPVAKSWTRSVLTGTGPTGNG